MSAEELFQTYSPSGEPEALVPRGEVHQLGLWHRAVNVFLFRSDGRLVVQCRAASKDVCPGAWDLSVAEHLVPGEDYVTAAHRGLAEELAVTGVDLQPVGDELQVRLDKPEQDLRNYEFQRCFTGVSDAPITLDPLEVSAFELLPLDELESQMTANPGKFTPWFVHLAGHVGLFDRMPR